MTAKSVGIAVVGHQLDSLISFVVEAVVREVLTLDCDTVVKGHNTLRELDPTLDAADLLQIRFRLSNVFCLAEEELTSNQETLKIHGDSEFRRMIKVADICARVKQALLQPACVAA